MLRSSVRHVALSPFARKTISEFHKNGVVVIRNCIPLGTINRLADAVEQAIAHPTPSAAMNDEMRGPAPRYGGFLRDYYTWRQTPGICDFVFNSSCAEIAGRLLQSSQVNLFYDQLFVKEPEYRALTPWHQDQAYYAVAGRQIASTWVTLDPVPHNASMRFLLGSHLWGNGRDWLPARFISSAEGYTGFTGNMRPLPPIDDGIQYRDGAEYFEHNGELHPIVTFEVNPGDVLVFHAALLHSAPGNPNMTRRRAIALRWVGDDCTWIEKDASHDIPNTPTPHEAPKYMRHGSPLREDEVAFPVGWKATKECV